MTAPSSSPLFRALRDDLKDQFQLDRRAEWKACNAIHGSARPLVFSEDVLQQLRSAVSDFRLLSKISRSRHRYAEPDDPRHSVERSQILPRDGESVERRELRRPSPRSHIELRPNSPGEFRCVAFRRKHSAQKKRLPVCTASA